MKKLAHQRQTAAVTEFDSELVDYNSKQTAIFFQLLVIEHPQTVNSALQSDLLFAQSVELSPTEHNIWKLLPITYRITSWI